MATIPQAFAIALQHHQAGRLQAAEQIYRQILTIEPDHVDAIHLLGVIAHQSGKYEVAVDYIGRAIRLQGNAALLHNNLGEAYRALQRISEAIACFQRALELKPDYVEAHANLGIAFKEQGKPDKALACCRRALELKPDHAELHFNLGLVFQEQGKLHEAAACYRRALELKPDHAGARNNLGNTLKEQGNLDEAIACFRQALELNPGHAETHYNLGDALRGQRKLDEAIACYRRALELKPDFAEAHGNLGSALEEMGDFQGAEGSFRNALRHNSRSAFAHYKLAEMLRGKLPHQDLAAQRRLLEEVDLTDEQRLLLHFGLAQVLDARGEYAEAAMHLDRGHSLQLSAWRKCSQEYDPKGHAVFVDRMIAACTADFFERVRGFGLESELPVFVVGLPRSGTTLIEQILASHCHVFGAGETKLVPDTLATLGGALRRVRGGPAPVGSRDGPASRFRALGETSRIESPSASHRGQVAGELLVSRSVDEPLPAGKVDPLPSRLARRGRLLLDDAFPGTSLGRRPTAHCFTISRVPTDHGSLAEGPAGAPLGSGLRGDGG